MNKIYNSFFDETYYVETLSNGLTVTIYHKPDFVNSTVCFGTPFGALDLHQKVNKKHIDYHAGIAHFLEHKLFESKGNDIMNAFSLMGANVNAFTSYNETIYFFSKSGDDIDEPLNLLLDFVQDLDISEESVEKEKGIIAEELAMYKQNPDTVLINETYKNMYHYYPLNNDIGGDEKTIRQITKQELEDCYRYNYQPGVMNLVIVSPIDPSHLMEIVKTNQEQKHFDEIAKPLTDNQEEPIEVVKNHFDTNLPINKDKLCYAIKLMPNFKDDMDALIKEYATKMYLNAYFSKKNPHYQTWIDEKIINDYFGFEVDFSKEYAYILFYNEYDAEDVFKALIDNELKEDLLTKESIALQKRRTIGSLFKGFDNIEDLAISITRSKLDRIDIFEMIDQIQALSYEDIKKNFHDLDLSHTTLIHLHSQA